MPIRGEHGAAIVFVVLLMPLFIMCGVFVIDVANFWVHKRHLQTQADAAALAGGAMVQPGSCDYAGGVHPAVLEYGQGPNNPQVGGVPNSKIEIVDNTDPCNDMFVEVDVSETDVGGVFGAITPIDKITAHAKVAINQISNGVGTLPMGWRKSEFETVGFQFMDLTASTPVAIGDATEASCLDPSNGECPDAEYGLPVDADSLTVDKRRIGVRAIVSDTGSLECGETGVYCYDPEDLGVAFLRGYTTQDVPTHGRPRIRNAYMDVATTTCDDPYFAYVQEGACSVSLTADIGWNPAVSTADILAGKVRAYATVDGVDYEMRRVLGSTWKTGTSVAGVWIPGATIPVAEGEADPLGITMKWKQTVGKVTKSSGSGTDDCTKGNGCSGTFDDPAGDTETVARVMPRTTANSGPIESFQVQETLAGIPTRPAYSFRMCEDGFTSCSHDLYVSIKLQGINGIQVLHVGDSPGSQNHALDCDTTGSPAPSLADEIIDGCKTSYQVIEDGENCIIDPTTAGEDRHCVDVQTGDATGQLSAFNERFLGPDWVPADGCTNPNKYSVGYTSDDPRIVKVFVTSYGSFGGSGNEALEVRGFAWMYVTGWRAQKDGNNDRKNPCASVTGPTAEDPSPDDDTRAALWGRFIDYVGPSGDGSYGTESCDFDDQTRACVAMLVE